MDDGSENIAGCQNADQMAGAIEDRNRTYLFIKHDVGDLADLRRRGGGQDPAAHYTGELVLGERSWRIDGFQLMRMGQQVVLRYHSDQCAVDRRHREMVNPLAFHHSPCLQQCTVGRHQVTGEVIMSCARRAPVSVQDPGAPVAGRPVERGVLHGQQSGAPDPLSDPLDQPQQPEWQGGRGDTCSAGYISTMPLTAHIIGMSDLVTSLSEASGKYLILEGFA